MAFYAGEKLKAAHLGQLSTTARYQATADQTITTATSTFVSFDSIARTSSLVTRAVSGAGHSFTLNSSGLWAISSTVRFTAQASGYREAWIEGPVDRLASNTQIGSTAGDATLNLATIEWFDAGTVLSIAVYQNSGSNATLHYDTTFGWGRINLAYLLGEG